MRLSLSILCGALLSLSALPAQISYLSASLDGAQENPPVVTPATGWGLARLDQSTGQVNIFLQSQGLVSTNAHMHKGAIGVNGGVVIPLNQGPTGRWTGSGTLSAVDMNDLLIGNMYLNVHSVAHPPGEIRGQLQTPTSQRFVGDLLGANVVPPSPSPARGAMVAYLHQPDGVLIYELTVTGMVGAAAHLNIGPLGVPGPILFPLMGTSGTRWCGVQRGITGQALIDLLSGNLYVDVPSGLFPNGEIRSQLLADNGDFFAPMDGFQQVPPVITPAIGQGTFSLRPDRSLDYDVKTLNLVGGTNAHIHPGPAGVNGPVIHPLVGGPNNWLGTTAPLSAMELGQLMSGGLYTNVHSIANPPGEIRGQMLQGSIPTTYGAGCPDASGNLAEIGAIGFPSLGSKFQVTLRGARPGTAAVCLFGRGRDLIGAVSLPADLSFLAMPGCFLLHDTRLTSLTGSTNTDADGCASVSVNVPLTPALIGFTGQAQWYIVDPLSVSPIPLVNSNGLEWFLQ